MSNIALPSFGAGEEILPQVTELGFVGLEVAPSKVWPDIRHVSPAQVERYRRQVEAAGLTVIGLHSLFFDQPQLGLFRGQEIRTQTMDFLVNLARICADLGGRTLVYGSPGARRRGNLAIEAADAQTISFFRELSLIVADLGVCFVLEALGPQESDYINTATQALGLTRAVNHTALRSHLDAKAVIEAGEAHLETFSAVASTLVHFHANDPDLGVLGASGRVDHALLGSFLREIGYVGYVSLEQRLLDSQNPLRPLRQSRAVMEVAYV